MIIINKIRNKNKRCIIRTECLYIYTSKYAEAS